MTETTLPRPLAAPAASLRGLGAAVARAAGRSQPLLLTAHGLWDLSDQRVPHADFASWCKSHAGQACTVWLGADLLVDLPAGEEPALREPTARNAWARRVLQHYHGDDALTWALWPWRLRGAAGVGALRGVSLPALQAQAEAQGVTLRAVPALWPQLLSHAGAAAGRQQPLQTCWLVEAALAGGIDAAPVLTQVGLVEGRITSLHRRRLHQPLGTALRHLLDAAGQPGTHTLVWWGAAPVIDAAWPPELQPARVLPGTGNPALPATVPVGDFLKPLPRASSLAWAWLATCAAVLGVSALEAHAAWQSLAEARVPTPRMALAATPGAAPGRADAAPPRTATAAERNVQSLRELQSRRAHPWGAVFGATETPAVAGLRWLSMEHGATGELRLQGLAPEPGAVQHAAAALRSQAPWQHVLVARLEAQDLPPPNAAIAPASAQAAAPGASLLSFEILARLRPPAP